MEIGQNQIEVVIVSGEICRSNSNGGCQSIDTTFSELVNLHLKMGWRIMSAPLIVRDNVACQQLYRESDYLSDTKKAIDLLVKYQNANSNSDIRELREQSYKFTLSIKNLK